jgi:hypothetical protein
VSRRCGARWTLAAAGAIGAAVLAGVVQAQNVQPSPADLPPEEPVRPIEEPPPAPGEITPSTVPPADPLAPLLEPDGPLEPEAAAAPDAPEEKKEEEPEPEPLKRPRHRAAILQAVDKITAETMRFEAQVGRPVRYKGLVFTVRACETSAADEPMKDSMAYLEIRAEPRARASQAVTSRQVFRGWMFASAPGLNALEHPVYDAWVISCRAPAPSAD